MLDKEKWEESRHEAKDLAQDYLDKEKTRSSCIKYFKETVESEIDKCMKKLKDLTIEEKVNVLTKITKLKKDLKKL